MNRRLLGWTTTACALALWPQIAWAQFSSGSTGAEGAFSPVSNQNLTVKPGGVYHYTTVNIPAGVTVNYFRNSDNAPVVPRTPQSKLRPKCADTGLAREKTYSISGLSSSWWLPAVLMDPDAEVMLAKLRA